MLKRKWKAPKSQAQVDQDLEEEFDQQREGSLPHSGPSQDKHPGHQANGNRPASDSLPLVTYRVAQPFPPPTPENYDLKNLESSFQNIIRVCEGIINPSNQSSVLHAPSLILRDFINGTSCTPPSTPYPPGHVVSLVQQCFWAERV